MLSKLVLLISFSGAAFGQTVVNGQNYIPCAASVALNPAYLAEYLDLNCAVTSLTIPAGAAGKPYHLTIYQDGGSLTSIPAAISGDMSLNSTGYTSFRMVWDQPTSSWRTTKIGVVIPTKTSQLMNDAGFVTSGTVGPQGPIGLTGATGPASTVPGPTGATGAASTVSGPQGVAGTNGINGTSATATVGTVTNLACGATPTVTNTGTTSAAVFAFGIPQCADLVGTGTIPAATLAIAGCSAAVTIPVTGAIVGHRVDVMLASGALPATNVYLNGSVTSAGNVSAVQCATVGLGLTALPVRVSVGP